MTDTQLIALLMEPNSIILDIFPDLNKHKDVYKEYIRLIHTDKCSHPKAVDATMKLNDWRDIINKGETYRDDAGEVRYFQQGIIETIAEPLMLKHSFNNWQTLRKATGDIAEQLHLRIPEEAILEDNKLTFKMDYRALPLSQLMKKYGAMDLKHVNWVVSRTLEFASLMHGLGYSHCGITPDSVYVVPETHGIYVTSFYHMAELDGKVSTVSSRYKNFYPPSLFTEKKAVQGIDIDLCKRTAIYMLGDQSALGNKLKGKMPADILAFLMKPDSDSFACYKEWRAVLTKNFAPQFHVYKV